MGEVCNGPRCNILAGIYEKKRPLARYRHRWENNIKMKGTVCWDVAMYNLVENHRYFGGTYCLHFQGRKVSLACCQQETSSKETFKFYRTNGMSQKIFIMDFV
jgi:hypothetical protein